jgi:hypothetical protein
MEKIHPTMDEIIATTGTKLGSLQSQTKEAPVTPANTIIKRKIIFKP